MVMLNIINYLPLLVALSEREKRLIGIVLFVILSVIYVIGIIANFFVNLFDARGKEIDHYLSDMLEFKIIKEPKYFRRYVTKREHRSLYLAIKWPTRLFIVSALLMALFITTALEGDYNIILKIIDDLVFEINFPTQQFFGLNIINDWPFISVPTVLDYSTNGIYTYAFLTVFFYWSLILINSLFNFAARSTRASRYSRTSFGKSLDAFTYRGGNNNAPKV
jgi:hypothetical protein